MELGDGQALGLVIIGVSFPVIVDEGLHPVVSHVLRYEASNLIFPNDLLDSFAFIYSHHPKHRRRESLCIPADISGALVFISDEPPESEAFIVDNLLL